MCKIFSSDDALNNFHVSLHDAMLKIAVMSKNIY